MLGLSGCGTGFDAQTNQAYQPGDGSIERTADVDLLGVVAVDNADDTATISASIMNKSDADDRLVGVTGAGRSGDAIDVEVADPVDLPPGDLVSLGEEPEVVLSSDELAPGYFTDLTFEFENAGPVDIDVPVVSREESETYAEIAEAPEPEPEPKQDADTKNDPKQQ